ncbi:MAG: rhodanese-like domain-containing protein [Rhizomicrobium sp.]|nr:rhodanese-like domain-containing protein [Rhizomicrobium sp.]
MALPLGAALAVFLAAGAAPDATGPNAPSAQQQMVPVIAPQALREMIASQRVALIDVREPAEYAAGHIDGAVLVPLNMLGSEYAKLPRDIPLVVYCRSGQRSARAVAFLIARGFSRAVSLAGGYLAYSAH